MVDHSNIRRAPPSIAFLFARLGGLLDSSSDPLGVPPFSSSDQYPRIRDFVVGPGGLNLALGDLYPLLHKSLSWFESIRGDLRRENMESMVRSSGPERGSSSNVGVDGAGTDTATSMPVSEPSSSNPPVPSASRSFHALKEKCTLKVEVRDKFRDRFQFLNETRARLPRKGEKACAFAHGEVCFYEAAFLCGLRLPVHPFIMELINHLNIAPRQLMLNSWRIVITCMVI